eukprot:TRINITY_DN14081_c0_g1_i1.p2 TRINITY_DN14081_c0_g1~~TRINITY_DN14081_c0_g1_i1.p2  ORF type:complete len:234 (-),score=86.52 TRINITY_DN14081_c0_g1_i1:897-1598(-)
MLKGKQADAILMKESELRRIKNSTKITTKKEEAEQRKRLEEQKEKEQEASELLKTKMKQFDQVRAKKMPLTEYQREELEKNQALLENAQKVIDEEMDDVKDMNKMIHYAKCVTIRDRQIEEAKRLEKQRKDDDLKMDTAMEIERLKVLKANEEREKERRETQRQGKGLNKRRRAGDNCPDKGQGAGETQGAEAEGGRAARDAEGDQSATGGRGQTAGAEDTQGKATHGNCQRS